ncbi:MAG: hypothetical protein HY852_16360 [Bradyrhizobium sp.]|uniref:hypothetical protein n=1 Tax=Bradyrhizobium sp. TaxID=376 RepID=UPI0025C23DDB|nr:hypothetical protein [Bradyrhizobium sp.]MBI5263383.1 hypothetical protein [Bradyrhizobium sp.]
MRSFFGGAILVLLLAGNAVAEPVILVNGKLRVADAATDACLANCATQNESCKRVCPMTLSTPCISSCDSQAQTCRQSCQGR